MRERLLQHASRSITIASAAPIPRRRLAVNAAIWASTPASIFIQNQYILPRRRHFADDRKPSTPSPSSDPIQLGAPNDSGPPPPDSIEAQIQQVAEKHRRAKEEAEAAARRKEEEEAKRQKAIEDAAREDAEAREKAAKDRVEREKAAEVAEPEKLPASDIPPPEGEELPSALEARKAQVTKKLNHVMDNLQKNLFVASQHINDLTGYSAIDSLKRDIITQEARLAEAQEDVRQSRLKYKQLVADRAASQREVTTLLARKDTWTPIDLERFTNLYRSDHTNEQAVQNAAQYLADVERNAEQAASKLNASILARYHEEQIWSDKIRRMSTWGTWGLMGMNVFIFLVFQFGFEPWRRERLTRGFEDKVKAALESEREAAAAESARIAAELAAGQSLVPATTSQIETRDMAEDVAPEVVAAIEEYVGDQLPETSTTDPASTVLTPIEMERESTADQEVLPSAEQIAEEELTSPPPYTSSETRIPAFTADWKRPETWEQGLFEPAMAMFQDLFSERVVSVRMADITMIALQSVASGAAIATVAILWTLRPN